jgi:hypothetical protein
MRMLGLYLDPPYLSLAVIETKGGKTKICSLRLMASVTPENVKQLYIQEAPQHISIALPTLIRHLQFKMSSSKQIAQILPFQVESLTSMNLQDIIYTADFHTSKAGTESTIFLTSKEHLKNSLDEWKTYSLIPDRVTTTFAALVKFSQACIPDLMSAFIVDLGSQKWTCVWMENGEVKKGFTIDQGIESMLAALWEDQKKVLFQKEVEGVATEIDLLQLKAPLNPHLLHKLEQLRNSLSNVLYSFQKDSGIKPVFFTGRTDAFGHLREYLLGPVSEFPLYESNTPLSVGEQKCAIAIGSAMEQKIQLLKDEFTPSKVWEKAGSWGIFLFSISLLLTIILSLSGHSKFQAEKEEIADSFKKILSRADKTFANSLFLGSLEKGIEEAALAIQKYDKETPYILQAPSVTEVLSWISSHPLIEALRTTDDPLEIVGVKYQLVSFPHIESMRDKYVAKVDLEFCVKSPMNARKFHEALLQGDDLVNAGEEFVWDSSENTYRTSFFLKNKASNVY